MLNLQQRLEIAVKNKGPRNYEFHMDEINGGFDPENELYKFIKNIKKLSIEEFLVSLKKMEFPIHGFHKDKNGLVRNNLCDVLMFSNDTDFLKELLQNINIFEDYEKISHFGHHLHQIKIHKPVPGYRHSKDYPITEKIFLLLDHVKKNNLIEKFDTGDINGNTPFMLFMHHFSEKEIIEKFISIGCNINHINKDGDNILHILARKNKWKCEANYDYIMLLISLGVDPFLQNNEKITPYSLIPESKRNEIVPLKQNHVTSVNPYELLMDPKNIAKSFDMKNYLEEKLGIFNLEDLNVCTEELHHDIKSKLKDVPGLRYESCYPQYFS